MMAARVEGRSEMKKKTATLAMLSVIAAVFICMPADAKARKGAAKNEASCPANMSEGDCSDYQEGYLNGVADRGVGAANVFMHALSPDAYQLGYEKGWRGGRLWE